MVLELRKTVCGRQCDACFGQNEKRNCTDQICESRFRDYCCFWPQSITSNTSQVQALFRLTQALPLDTHSPNTPNFSNTHPTQLHIMLCSLALPGLRHAAIAAAEHVSLTSLLARAGSLQALQHCCAGNARLCVLLLLRRNHQPANGAQRPSIALYPVCLLTFAFLLHPTLLHCCLSSLS